MCTCKMADGDIDVDALLNEVEGTMRGSAPPTRSVSAAKLTAPPVSAYTGAPRAAAAAPTSYGSARTINIPSSTRTGRAGDDLADLLSLTEEAASGGSAGSRLPDRSSSKSTYGYTSASSTPSASGAAAATAATTTAAAYSARSGSMSSITSTGSTGATASSSGANPLGSARGSGKCTYVHVAPAKPETEMGLCRSAAAKR